MKKVILQMQVTLDGFVSGPQDELDWIDFDPEMGNDHYELAEHADLTLMGHTVYQAMAGYWPEVVKNPEGDPQEIAYAKLVNSNPKLVFSTKQEQVTWENSTLCVVKNGDDLAEKVRQLKQQGDGYLLLSGGLTTARTFIEHGLIDEYRLDVCPVALGEGKPLFASRENLALLDVKKYKSGAIGLTYQTKA